jgi:type IV secretory pathway VirB6-like protein
MNWITVLLSVIILVAMFAIGMILVRLLFRPMLRLLSSLSGWQNLSTRFPEIDGQFEATTWRFCSVRLGGIDYKSCVTTTLSEEHVTLKVGFPFRDFHPNFSIPCSLLDRGLRSTFWMKEFLITDEQTSLWLSNRVASKLLQ